MPGTKAGNPLILSAWQQVLVALLPLVAMLTACQPTPVSKQQFLQFGTLIDIAIVHPDERHTLALFDAIEELLKKQHRQWHGWQDGDLKHFNAALLDPPGSMVAIPNSLVELVGQSAKFHHISGGLFNPALGKLIAAWGFHESATPNHQLIKQIQSDIPGMHDLVIEQGKAYTRNPHLQLDFGAIAKGLAVKQIAELLQHNKVQHFIINAGGDVYAHGSKHKRPWRVAIEDPFAAGIIASMNLDSGDSIFTSGNYRRFYQDKDKSRRHHIINPLTGKPSRDISAVTVLHPDPVIADIAATTLMLTPIDQLDAMANRLNISRYLVISENRQIYLSETLAEKLDWHDHQGFTLHVV